MPTRLDSVYDVQASWERCSRRVSSFHHSSTSCSSQHGPRTPYTPTTSTQASATFIAVSHVEVGRRDESLHRGVPLT